MNNTLRKCMSLILCPCISAYSLPSAAYTLESNNQIVKFELTDEAMSKALGANGSVDATMADYKLGGTIATAVITNRFSLDCNYEMNLVDTNGVVQEVLASGTIAAGATKLITGTPPVGGTANRYIQARIYHPGLPGLEAIDASWAKSSIDSDADGITDANELANGLDPFNPADADADFDGDTLSNRDEINLYRTNIYLADTDGDSINDGDELANGLNPRNAADADLDLDQDFLTNAEEINLYGSNINVANPGLAPDTDNDGVNDKLEAALGSNPNDATSNSVGSDSLDDKKIAHMLNRVTFGATPALIAEVKNKTIPVWLDEQLIPISLDESPADPAQVMRDNHYTAFGAAERIGAIRPVHSEKQLQARMAMFWDNHFNTSVNKTGTVAELFEEDLFFVNAFGNFRELLGLSAKGHAMLRYLDLRTSRKQEPNENYGREVMELYTLGRTTDSGLYDATTIAELSRILTGWSSTRDPNLVTPAIFSRYQLRGGGNVVSNPEVFQFYFRANNHDTNAKTLTIGGISNEFAAGGGVEEGDRALDILATHPVTAENICTKLANYLISDTPSAATIDSCKTTFLATASDPKQITHVLQDLLYSTEFNAESTFGSKFKDNQEYMFGLSRFTDTSAIGNTAFGTEVFDSQSLGERIEDMGQGQFQKPEPTGWDESAESWINSNSVLGRFREGNKMVLKKPANYYIDYFTNQGLTTSGEIMGHLFQVLLGSRYDVKHMTLGYWALHPAHSAFDITSAAAETRIENLIMRIIQLPEYNTH